VGGTATGRVGKGNHTPTIHVDEKSDAPIVPKKPTNKAQAAETAEGRGAAKGNTREATAGRTPSRETAVTGLERVRETAKRDRRLKFTALLHHITPKMLVESFYDLNRTAAVGVDGVTWQDYEAILHGRVHELHRQIHTGAYRAQASRRTYIAKADGKLRPLGIAAVEDKIVQQAVVKVLSAIYEEDFLGFSYGFRPGRGQHDALDAVWMGIETRQISWILDADISAYFADSVITCLPYLRQPSPFVKNRTSNWVTTLTLAAIREKLKKRRHDPKEQVGNWLKSVLRGYYNYFAVPDNLKRLEGFRREVSRAWRAALGSRSQKGRMTWARFERFEKKYLPMPRRVHPYPSQRFAS
jgi:hypothetical protein